MQSTEHNARGFSLVELLVAIALGLIVLAATTQLFKQGMGLARAVGLVTAPADQAESKSDQ